MNQNSKFNVNHQKFFLRTQTIFPANRYVFVTAKTMSKWSQIGWSFLIICGSSS
ncbi:hypothetical protein HanRHA438_Chr09g0406661 [Helianthus annuus]|nr:hypothetical protein HanRHA438_Chr09g0406661 [Helianthus annuus]